jgi:hypothetical protein
MVPQSQVAAPSLGINRLLVRLLLYLSAQDVTVC